MTFEALLNELFRLDPCLTDYDIYIDWSCLWMFP